jgi:hypothetical protein
MRTNGGIEEFGTPLDRPGHQSNAKALLIVPTRDGCLACKSFHGHLAPHAKHPQAPGL